jgi:DNA repair exonuclease SbcCD ATPase subunit
MATTLKVDVSQEFETLVYRAWNGRFDGAQPSFDNAIRDLLGYIDGVDADRKRYATTPIQKLRDEIGERDKALDAMSNELAELKASDKGELEALQRDFQALLDEKEATRRELAAVRVSFNDADKARLELCDRFDSFEAELRRETKAALDARNDLEEALKENTRLVSQLERWKKERHDAVQGGAEELQETLDKLEAMEKDRDLWKAYGDKVDKILDKRNDDMDAAERAMDNAELRIEELRIRCERQDRVVDALLDKGGQ